MGWSRISWSRSAPRRTGNGHLLQFDDFKLIECFSPQQFLRSLIQQSSVGLQDTHGTLQCLINQCRTAVSILLAFSSR